MSFTGLLDRTMDISSITITAGTYLDQVVGRATGATAIPCRIRELSATERDIMLREGYESTHRIYCDGSVVIGQKDEAVCGGMTLRITRVHNVDLTGHHLEIDGFRQV